MESRPLQAALQDCFMIFIPVTCFLNVLESILLGVGKQIMLTSAELNNILLRISNWRMGSVVLYML